MLTFDNFKRIYDKSGRPYYWLYKGKSKADGNLIDSNPTVENIGDAWKSLEETLEAYGDGYYTVLLRTSPNAGSGQTSHTFLYGAEDAPAVGAAAAPRRSATPEFEKGLNVMYFLEQTSTLRDQLSREQMQNIRLQLQLEQMKRDQETQKDSGVLDRVVGIVEKNPSVLGQMIGLLSGNPQPAAVGVLRSPQPIQPQRQPVEPDDDGDDDGDEWEDTEPSSAQRISLDAIVGIVYRLQSALPDVNVQDVLEQLATTAEQDPGKIEMALKFL